VYPLVRGMYNKREGHDQRDRLAQQVQARPAKSWTPDVNYSKAKRDELNLENNTQLAPRTATGFAAAADPAAAASRC
jgi:hypothetical protein